MQLYLHYVSISIRSQMQYRASFLMIGIAQLLATGAEFLAIWALFARFGSLRGWSLAEIALLYGIISVGFALAEGVLRGFDTFSAMVRTGDFDRLLLRPRSTAFQVAAQEVRLDRFGRLLQGVAVLGWALARLPIAWSFAKVLLLVATIAGAAALFAGLLVVQATMSFWTIESLELMNTVTYGGIETAQYPLSAYRPWFRGFFTFVVPLACANYLPAHALLGRADVLGSPVWAQWLSPLVGIAFLGSALKCWRLGVRHYSSTGS